MSGGWPDRSAAKALYRPPRRALLTVGAVAVPASVFVSGDFTTAGFIGLSALTAFFMGHIERGMHGDLRRSSRSSGGHSADESTGNSAHSTQNYETTTEED